LATEFEGSGGWGGISNVPLASSGAMVMTDPEPFPHVVDAAWCPSGQLVLNPTDGHNETNSGEAIRLGQLVDVSNIAWS